MGAAHTASTSQSVRRLRAGFTAASVSCDCIKHQYRGGQRKPLECVAVVPVYPEIRGFPFAHEAVVQLAVLPDRERLDADGYRFAVALDRQVLPDAPFD